MIHYNNLYITEDSKYLVIDVAIDEDSTYDDVYLDRIAIDTQDTYITNGPSNNAKIFHIGGDDIEGPSINGIEEVKNSGKDIKKVKHTKLTLSAKDLGVDLNKDMLFIYSTASGFIPEDKQDVIKYITNTILNVVVNTYEVYKSIIPLIKEIADTCKEPTSFINRELQIKAVEYAIKSSNYILAIKYWRKYFMNSITATSLNKCNCNAST